MKRFITSASVLLILAGCSSAASGYDHKPVIVSDQKNSVSSNEDRFSRTLKLERNTVRMKQVIKYLRTRVERTPYVFSGSSPRGWDCSGLVRWTYERFGLEIPHSADKQAHIGKRVSNPAIGDIVVFAYKGSHSFYHSAIYIGNNKIINAHYGSGSTIIQPLTDYKNSQIRYVRVVPQKSNSKPAVMIN